MPRKDLKSLEAFATEQKAAQFSETAAVSRDLRAERIRARELEDKLKEVERKLGLYEHLSKQMLAPPKWLTPARRAADHVGIPCLVVSDPHSGAVVDPAQVDWVNAYTPTIAEMRLKKLFERSVKLTRDYLTGVRYEGIQLFLAGDNFSGNIHDELRETNALTIAESIVGFLEPMAAGINLLANSFDKVHIAAVVGNHGRVTIKPRAKNRSRDNYDGLLYRLLY